MVTKLFIYIFLLILLVTSCISNDSPAPTPTLTPPPTVQVNALSFGNPEFIANFIQGFEAANPGYDIDLMAGAEIDQGIQALASDTAQVIGMSHPPTEQELALVPDLKYVEMGKLGIGLLTREDTGVTALTLEQAQDIFSGKITNWSEVGGPDQPIRLFIRIEGVLPTQMMKAHVMGDSAFAETATSMKTSVLMVESVASTPYSIGYEVWPVVLLNGADVIAIKLDGRGPTDPDYLMLASAGIGYRAKNEAAIQPIIERLKTGTGRKRMEMFGIIMEEVE